jgi:hypothetical protein
VRVSPTAGLAVQTRLLDIHVFAVDLRAATRSGSPSSSRLVGFAGCHTLGLTILLALCGYTSCDTLGLTILLKTSG